jgi:hypothetical protein
MKGPHAEAVGASITAHDPANRPAANAGSRWIAEGGLRSLLSADGPFMHTVLVMADVFGALVLQPPE